VAMAGVRSVESWLALDVGREAHPAPVGTDGITALHFETRHGEQLTRRLADNSVVHLNTDSAVTIRYGKTERLVISSLARQASKSPTSPIARFG